MYPRRPNEPEPIEIVMRVKVAPELADRRTIAQLRALFDEFALLIELLEAVRCAEVGVEHPGGGDA
jgi:hypothetical protein